MEHQNQSNLSDDAWRYISYLSFKMDCAREQEETRWGFLKDKAQGHFDDLTVQQEAKVVELSKAMPKRVLTKQVNKPKVMVKKDESVSAHGIKWYDLLKQQGLPKDTVGPITVISGYEDGNPKSPLQVKNWLYSLGWKPATWKFSRDKVTSEEKKVEQVRYQAGHDREGELCDSVTRLDKYDPAVTILDGLTVITHRLGFFKSMLENSITDESGKSWLKAEIAGLTNTLRFKHSKPLANLPSVGKAWGEEIRGCLVAPSDDDILIGCDMVSLESMTKRHYMQPHDPDYVEEMSKEGFDEHLSLAVFAGALTQEDVDDYQAGNRPDVKVIRSKYKPINYSAIYGIGSAKLAREMGIPVKEAQGLIDAYWQRNWSVKTVASEIFTKTTKGKKLWLKQPVSGFWYSLRNDRDIWSTTNQGTGVYCFDKLLSILRDKGVKITATFHDEFISSLLAEDKGKMDKILKDSCDLLNDQLGMNVKMGVDHAYGKSYAEVH